MDPGAYEVRSIAFWGATRTDITGFRPLVYRCTYRQPQRASPRKIAYHAVFYKLGYIVISGDWKASDLSLGRRLKPENEETRETRLPDISKHV
jgi:hypothetical protein